MAYLGQGTAGTLLVGAGTTSPAFTSSANANFTFGGANDGATRTLSITNTSDVGSSSAKLQITTGGALGEDPFITHTITGATSWSSGIDNSAVGDPYVIAASTALGTTNVMSMATGGNVSFVLGNLDVTRASSGATVSETVSNTSNTASSNALQQVTVAGTSAGDAFTTYTVSGTTNWSQGIDNSVTGDPFVLAASTALGTTNVMSVTTSGQQTLPLQPAFLAHLVSGVSNVTGDGTAYQLGTSALTEIFDQGNNFDTNGTFTAPVTGKYCFQAGCYFTGCTIANTLILRFVATSRTIQCNQARTSGAADFSTSGCIFVDMAANDTLVLNIIINGEAAATCDLAGDSSGNYLTWISGYLIC